MTEDLWESHRRAMLGARTVLARPSVTTSMREGLESMLASGVYDLDGPPDLYGDGVVAHLERRVADLLGKPAAAFFPTGTMAQQVVLRCWAARTGSTRVGVHALSHPEVFEARAFPTVSGLETVPLASGPRLVDAEAVRRAPADVGAVMLELPLRDAGYLLPSWEELRETTSAARERGMVVHVDGARLWECKPHFGRSYADIASLADTVYVSCYKSVDGLSGALVAGPEDLLAEARVWRHRYGGRVHQQYPAALSALAGLDDALPRVADDVAAAQTAAAEIRAGLADGGLGWFLVQPAQPHIRQFQVWVASPADVLTRTATELLDTGDRAVFQLPWWEPGMPPGLSVTEVTVDARALADWPVGAVREEAARFARAVVAVVALVP